MNLRLLWTFRLTAHRKRPLSDESKRLINPQEVYVDLSRKLYDLKNQLLDDAHTIKD